MAGSALKTASPVIIAALLRLNMNHSASLRTLGQSSRHWLWETTSKAA